MKVLFWMFVGFDQHATSEHLLIADIEQLCKAGHAVHILQKNTGGNLPIIPEKLNAYDVTTDVIPFKSAKKKNFVARYLVELKYIQACKKHIASNYDAVFIQSNNVAGFAVKALRKRLPKSILTINVQDVFPYNLAYCGSIKNNSLLFKLLAYIQRYGYKHSDHIITISEDMKDTLIADGTPAHKISVIYNWSYQDEPYSNVDLTEVSDMFNSEFFNVVYAGNIGIMQNVEVVIEAANLLSDEKSIRFHIIGDGVYCKKLKEKAKLYSLTNIEFWPMVPPRLAPAVYRSASVNIVPLAKNIYKTAFPSKTATCLACLRPTVFAIGKDSLFGKRIMEETGCPVIDSQNAEELKSIILDIRDKKVSFNIEDCFRNLFSVSKNSAQYATIITDKNTCS